MNSTKAYRGGSEMIELDFFEEVALDLSCKDEISLENWGERNSVCTDAKEERYTYKSSMSMVVG